MFVPFRAASATSLRHLAPSAGGCAHLEAACQVISGMHMFGMTQTPPMPTLRSGGVAGPPPSAHHQPPSAAWALRFGQAAGHAATCTTIAQSLALEAAPCATKSATRPASPANRLDRSSLHAAAWVCTQPGSAGRPTSLAVHGDSLTMPWASPHHRSYSSGGPSGATTDPSKIRNFAIIGEF